MDLIILVYLCFKIAGLAEQKNVSKIRWVLTTIFYWILGSTLANMLVMYALGIHQMNITKSEDLLNVMIEHSMYFMFAGLSGGFLGYLFARKRIENLPDYNGTIE